MNANKLWWIEERMKKTVDKLKAHDFDALVVKTREDAVREIHKYVTPDTKVGVGGSITIRELGILEPLKEKGNIVYDHWAAGLSKEQSREIRKSQLTSDLFLSSSNAVTMEGELVNVDGIGNRVGAITFGPKKVIIVAGYNKIVKNVEEAIKRVRNEATPPNSRRLNINVPCAKIGTCVDCDSPDRSCRVMVIHERKPALTDMLIILVGEELGY
jgi:L-lactate utilization protein LutB